MLVIRHVSERSLSCIEVQKMYWCKSIQVIGRPVRKLNSPNESYFIPSTNVEASSYLLEGRSIGLEESNGNFEHLNGELEIELTRH